MFLRHRNINGAGASRRSTGRLFVCLVSLSLLFALAIGGVAWAKVHQQAFGKITPAEITAPASSEQVLTVTLTDKHGDPVVGHLVEWFMQGVGFFINDEDPGDTSDPNNPNGNRDIDVTDAQGQATVTVKSFVAGEQLVHLKYRDLIKHAGGAEPPYFMLDATVTWVEPGL